jgi:hypothetical protein
MQSGFPLLARGISFAPFHSQPGPRPRKGQDGLTGLVPALFVSSTSARYIALRQGLNPSLLTAWDWRE